MNEQRDLGSSYRGFRLYTIVDGASIRGYAMRTLVNPDGSTSEDAFTLAGRDSESVLVRLRSLVDCELAAIEAAKRPAPAAPPRPPVLPVFEEIAPTVRLARMCSWCGRYERGGEWVPRDADATQPAAVSHSICPDCADRMLRKERE